MLQVLSPYPLAGHLDCSEGPCLARSLRLHRHHWRLVCPVLVPWTRSTARIGCSVSALLNTENSDWNGLGQAPLRCQRAS